MSELSPEVMAAFAQSNEHSAGEPSVEEVHDEVEDEAQRQLAEMKRAADVQLAQLKSQEQQKLQDLLSTMSKGAADNSVNKADESNHTEQVERAKQTDIDELLMEGQLLHPLAGLEKIRGVQQVQLDTMLSKINDTLNQQAPKSKEEESQ